MKVRVNQDKLNEVKDKLKPATTIWALGGIVFFFFVPEIVAFFWGDQINEYFKNLSHLYENPVMQKLCVETGEMFSENSLLNIIIGFGFVYWWYHERKKSSQS